MKVLVSGFEPFGGSAINPSKEIVCRLASHRDDLPSIDLHTCILPVVGGLAPAHLIEQVAKVGPDAVLCLGEAGRRRVISIERVFINLRQYEQPDNAGQTAADEPVVADGPAAYFSTLPVSRLRCAVEGAGVPCSVSLSAGAFLCNEVAYALLHDLARSGRLVPAGFIHVPRLPEQLGEHAPSGAGMPLEDMVRGITAAIRALARR